MNARSHIYDVAVLGAGVIGNFVAYDLAVKGFDTCLLERGYTAGGTSGATHAWVYVSTKTPGFYGRFSYASSLRYEELEREHGVDFEYVRCGGLSIIWTDEALAKARLTVAAQNDAGIECEVLTAEEVAVREPIVSPEHIKGAIYGPLDGCVNPFTVMHVMNRLARTFGATYRPYCNVASVAREGDAYRIGTSAGDVHARKIVVAAGINSVEVARAIGFELPVTPSRGHVLVSAPMPPTVRHILANGSVRQLVGRGVVLLGHVTEAGQKENMSTYEGLQKALKAVLALAPALGDAPIVRSYAGIRPLPFDGLPILGEVPGHPGVFTAVTHSGVTLAPIIGLTVAESIRGGSTSHDVTPYGWGRVPLAA